MLKVVLSVLVLGVVSVLVSALPQGLSYPHAPDVPPGCPVHPPFTPNCDKWCQIEGAATGQYVCCDSRGNNYGKCPTSYMSKIEITVLCDTTLPNYPRHRDCDTDSDCLSSEKCCHAPGNHQLVCRDTFFGGLFT